jgi:hypothetical protein
MFIKPKCRYCGRQWTPSEGVCAASSFCEECSTERREIARESFESAGIDERRRVGGYILPRSFTRGKIRSAG